MSLLVRKEVKHDHACATEVDALARRNIELLPKGKDADDGGKDDTPA